MNTNSLQNKIFLKSRRYFYINFYRGTFFAFLSHRKIKKHQHFKLLLKFGVEENNVLDLKQNSYKERKLL